MTPEACRVQSLHRIDCLDGIRASAALMVMFFHFVGHHGEPAWLVQAAVIGQTGVDLFFVLSGFLITRILLRSRDTPHFFKNFYVRRTLRIFPLYYAFLTIYFFLLPRIFGAAVLPPGSPWWSWLFLENVPATFPALLSSGPTHFWSLAVEEQFYLGWPFMVFILSRKNFARLVYASLLVPLLLRVLFLHDEIGVRYFTFTRIDALGYGALLAVLLTDESASPARCIPLFRGLLGTLPLLGILSFNALSDGGPDWVQAVNFSLVPAFYFALIGFCVIDPLARPLAAVFASRWLRWIGAISYGLYVFHPICFAFVQSFVDPSTFLIDLLLSFGLAILLASVSFRFFELPILTLKRHFRYETEPI